MRREWMALVSALVVVAVAGCSPPDNGIVMGCFGLVSQTVPGQDVSSEAVVTNTYFGGCDPTDPGMQIIERATEAAAADQDVMVAACNTQCSQRLAAYVSSHPGENLSLPLSCQTFFAIPCEGIKADVVGVGATAFQGGGPADIRMSLTGSVTLSGSDGPVQASGILDATLGPCQGANMNCAITLSRLDVVAERQFSFGGMQVSSAHVQNQGLAIGHKNAGEMLIPSGAIDVEVSANTSGGMTAFHVSNDLDVKTTTTGDLVQFLSNLDMTFGDGLVEIHMTGTQAGFRPVAGFTPRQATYECACKECTTAELTSTSTDQDNDLQSLAWRLDGRLQAGDGTGAPPTLGLALPLGPHTVSLVATDSRGAASSSSHDFAVVDTVAPVVIPPANVQMLSCGFPNIGQAAATDTCSDTLVITSNAPGSFPVGTTTVTWTAQDGSGNTGTATQTVTVTQAAFTSCCPAGSNVIVVGQNNTQPINGTAGDDCIIGTTNNDRINGLAGNDVIFGRGGQDVIDGGDGNDTIDAGDGDDTIEGGLGADKITGGTGQDVITGGGGSDVLFGGDGDDRIFGGEGDDVIRGNQGQDRLFGEGDGDNIDGGDGDDQISGGNGIDTLVGGVNNDTVNGDDGDDSIAGFDGDDVLNGGLGNDAIVGGRGRDTCTTGGGADALTSCEL